MDEKGCIRNSDSRIPFALFSEIQPLGMWKGEWMGYKQDTKIRIKKTYGLSWNERKSCLYVK